jgi:hypothetical protein
MQETGVWRVCARASMPTCMPAALFCHHEVCGAGLPRYWGVAGVAQPPWTPAGGSSCAATRGMRLPVPVWCGHGAASHTSTAEQQQVVGVQDPQHPDADVDVHDVGLLCRMHQVHKASAVKAVCCVLLSQLHAPGAWRSPQLRSVLVSTCMHVMVKNWTARLLENENTPWIVGTVAERACAVCHTPPACLHADTLGQSCPPIDLLGTLMFILCTMDYSVYSALSSTGTVKQLTEVPTLS